MVAAAADAYRSTPDDFVLPDPGTGAATRYYLTFVTSSLRLVEQVSDVRYGLYGEPSLTTPATRPILDQRR